MFIKGIWKFTNINSKYKLEKQNFNLSMSNYSLTSGSEAAGGGVEDIESIIFDKFLF